MAVDIAPHVQKVHGVDTSARMIELANQKVSTRQLGNIQFEQADIFDAQFKPDSYSAVVAFNIFHLVDNPAKTLARLNDLLSSGDVLISQTVCLGHHNWFIRTAMSAAQMLRVVPSVHKFTLPELEALISGANFEIIESKLWDEDDIVQWIVAKKK